MDVHELARQIEAMSQQANTLQQRTRLQQSASAELATEGLQLALEELQTSLEELGQQNEELQVTQIALVAECQRYQELFEFAPDAYVVTDSLGIIQEANRAAVALFGLSALLLQRKPLTNFVVAEERSMFRRMLSCLPQAIQEWEIRLHPDTGKSLDVIMSVTSLRDVDGGPLLLRWLIRDVTKRKQVEMQVHALNAELIQQVLFEATLRRIQDKIRTSLDEQQILQTAVEELGQALNLVRCDTAVYDLQKYTSTICCEYALPELVQPSTQGQKTAMADFAEGYQQLLQGQDFQFCEITTDPVRSQLSVLACPIVDHQEVLGDLWCFSLKDAALNQSQVRLVQQVASQCAIALRQSRLYQAAQAQVTQLVALNRLKDDFLSTVSHELRMPLTNMKMALHLLKVSTQEEQRHRCMQILQTECDREISLITDLLDLQQLETDLYPSFLLESTYLLDWLPIILAPLKQYIQEKQQVLTLDLPKTLLPIVTDQASLRRILQELVLNAHKYTPAHGNITLTLQQDSTSDQIICRIRNQTEIPAVELPRIFDKFYRIPQTDSWQQGGTGLGLALVKHLVAQIQGTIDVESGDGWTTFTLQIPPKLALGVDLK